MHNIKNHSKHKSTDMPGAERTRMSTRTTTNSCSCDFLYNCRRHVGTQPNVGLHILLHGTEPAPTPGKLNPIPAAPPTTTNSYKHIRAPIASQPHIRLHRPTPGDKQSSLTIAATTTVNIISTNIRNTIPDEHRDAHKTL